MIKAGDAIPAILSRQELAELLRLSLSRLDELRKLRSHPAIREILPRVGSPRFDGVAVEQWIGQKGSQEQRPRFFASARRKAS